MLLHPHLELQNNNKTHIKIKYFLPTLSIANIKERERERGMKKEVLSFSICMVLQYYANIHTIVFAFMDVGGLLCIFVNSVIHFASIFLFFSFF